MDSLNEIDWPGKTRHPRRPTPPTFRKILRHCPRRRLARTSQVTTHISQIPHMMRENDSSSGPTAADNAKVSRDMQQEQDYRASQIETAAVNKSRSLAQQAAKQLNDKIEKDLEADARDFVGFQLSLALNGATLGVGKVASTLVGGALGAVSGAYWGGKKGALIGFGIGALGGRFAPGISAYASDAVGGGLAGMVAGTATFT